MLSLRTERVACDVRHRERPGEDAQRDENENVEAIDRDLSREPGVRDHVGRDPDDRGSADRGQEAEPERARPDGSHGANVTPGT
jgi:hypothetical protein